MIEVQGHIFYDPRDESDYAVMQSVAKLGGVFEGLQLCFIERPNVAINEWKYTQAKDGIETVLQNKFVSDNYLWRIKA